MAHGFDECLLKPVSLGQFRRLLIRWGLLSQEAEVSHAPTSISTSLTPTGGSAIDQNAIISQMGAFDEGVIEMLKMFIDMTVPLIERVKNASDKKDIDDLKEAAHSLKGAARSACLNDLGEAAARLQNETESGGKNYAPMVEDILKEFVRAKNEIDLL